MAAEPILASSIWLASRTSKAGPGPSSARQARKLATGLRKLDQLLDGGLPYGAIACISFESGCDADQIIHHTLVSHLLSNATATATIIDSTLSFDLRRLHGLVKIMLQEQGQDAGIAMDVLKRLKIMKVFDFVGLTESVSEMREALNEFTRSVDPTQAFSIAPRGTVGDSEDEEEMLDMPEPSQPQQKPSPEERSGLLIIDNVAQLTMPLLKNNHVQGQALLTNFMRSLSHTTKAHNLCTLLVNGTTSYAQSKEETPSIFTSCVSRPALGWTFGYGLDMHLLMHMVPKTSADARVVYGERPKRHNDRPVEMINVIEVLQDRSGGCVGRWAAFTVDKGGNIMEM